MSNTNFNYIKNPSNSFSSIWILIVFQPYYLLKGTRINCLNNTINFKFPNRIDYITIFFILLRLKISIYIFLGHHASPYGGHHGGHGGYGYGHPAPHHVPHHSVAPLHHGSPGPHLDFAGPLHGAPHHGIGPLAGAPHHGGAYGVDLVGPYSQHDGPFGPFGFYANFYNHH